MGAAAGLPGDKCWGAEEEAEGGVAVSGKAAARGRLSLPLPAVLPLTLDTGTGGDGGGGGGLRAGSASEFLRQQHQAAAGTGAAAGAVGLSLAQLGGDTLEEYVLRRTKEFNAATRERPEELPLWLAFADFQLEAARLLSAAAGGRRGGALSSSGGVGGGVDAATAEKRVSILQAGLAHHPGSEALVSALLAASEPLLEPEKLCGRWQAVLERHKGSTGLWTTYLQRRLRMFSMFTVPRVQVRQLCRKAQGRGRL